MGSVAVRGGETGAAYTAHIESIAAGGAGVARLDGRVVFIPRTAPGDSVRFRIAADKGKYLRGDLDEVLEAGPSRREPPCPHWAECGGCPLQQIFPESQTEAKRRIFLDAIARIGKFELPVPLEVSDSASGEYAYRLRARFQVRENAIGFFAPGTRRLIPLERCLLVEESIAEALGEIRRLLQKDPAAREIESVEVTALGPGSGDGAGLFLYPPGARDGKKGALPRRARRAWDAFSRTCGWPVAAAGDRQPGEPPAWRATYEIENPELEYAPLRFNVSPESFIQPNRTGNRALVQSVLEMAVSTGGGTVVDLFCGVGNFTVPLAARGRRILGVENNPFALQDAESNGRSADLNDARFLRREAGSLNPQETLKALDGESPDLVLLDPPRRGALEAISLVLALRPRKIIYVSCNPATFARDAREINGGGYRIGKALLVSMFPNTAHVESVTSWNLDRAPA